MNALCDDVSNNMLKYLAIEDIGSLMKISRRFNKICDNEHMWEKLIKIYYPRRYKEKHPHYKSLFRILTLEEERRNLNTFYGIYRKCSVYACTKINKIQGGMDFYNYKPYTELQYDPIIQNMEIICEKCYRNICKKHNYKYSTLNLLSIKLLINICTKCNDVLSIDEKRVICKKLYRDAQYYGDKIDIYFLYWKNAHLNRKFFIMKGIKVI